MGRETDEGRDPLTMLAVEMKNIGEELGRLRRQSESNGDKIQLLLAQHAALKAVLKEKDRGVTKDFNEQERRCSSRHVSNAKKIGLIVSIFIWVAFGITAAAGGLVWSSATGKDRGEVPSKPLKGGG